MGLQIKGYQGYNIVEGLHKLKGMRYDKFTITLFIWMAALSHSKIDVNCGTLYKTYASDRNANL